MVLVAVATIVGALARITVMVTCKCQALDPTTLFLLGFHLRVTSKLMHQPAVLVLISQLLVLTVLFAVAQEGTLFLIATSVKVNTTKRI